MRVCFMNTKPPILVILPKTVMAIATDLGRSEVVTHCHDVLPFDSGECTATTAHAAAAAHWRCDVVLNSRIMRLWLATIRASEDRPLDKILASVDVNLFFLSFFLLLDL